MLPVRLIQKLPFFKKTNFGADLIVGNKLINEILSIIFYFDVWSVRWLSPPVGVSLLVIGKK